MITALEQYDPQMYELLRQEGARQSACIRLIPSENYVSKAVMAATGSCLTNKYSEGYPGKRYYEGQQVTDLVEAIAIERAKKLFKSDHANVQSHSGAVANLAAYSALATVGETIMGLALPYGGHLSHGWKVSFTSKAFNSVSYEVDPETGQFDFNKIEELAKKHKPKIIITGASAYPRKIDFKTFGEIAKRVGAYHLSDIAHISGLVVAGLHQSPVPYADVVSTTTHKTLRGPRGGMLLCTASLAEAVDRAVFPGLQGGPHMHTISALAVALKEADTPEFVAYSKQIVKNAKVLADTLMEKGFKLIQRRHRQSSYSYRPAQQKHPRQKTFKSSRQGENRDELQYYSRRPCETVQSERPSHRHTCRYNKRYEGRTNESYCLADKQGRGEH